MASVRLALNTVALVGGLLGLATSLLAYNLLKPDVDIIALLTPPAIAIIPIVYDLSRGLKVDLTPLTSTPLAYAAYHLTVTYVRQAENPLPLVYSITLGASLTLITITLADAIVRSTVIRDYRKTTSQH